MPSTIQVEPLLSAAQLAELWGVHKWTIQNYQRNFGLPSVKLGPGASSPRRFRLSDAEAWLLSRQPEGE
jgi:hypothetical protein